MITLKLIAFAAAVSSTNAQATAPEFAQCGGSLWLGATVCATGGAVLTCSSQNPWFYQCIRVPPSTLPPSPVSTRSPAPISTTKAQTTTSAKSSTTKKTTTTVKSTTTKKGPGVPTPVPTTTKAPVPTTTAKATNTQPSGPVQTPWGQCGGQGYTGPTRCSTGQICVYQNQFFSTCQPDPSVTTTKFATSYKTTTSVKPVETFNYLITFGDSYSQTGFDITGTKPSIGNQLGNPPLPGWTTAGGLNWIGDLLSSNTQLLSYNLASGGATTDANLVTPFAPTVLSFVDQVNLFNATLASKPSYAPWTAADTLFGVWIGVNDVGNAWYKAEWPTLSVQIIDQYFNQVQRLYNLGARKFVFLNVPPINRAPSNLGSDEWSQTTLKAAIQTYNNLIAARTALFNANNAGAQAQAIDIFTKFDLVLDNPTVYGAANSSCWNADGKTCLWWNDYHPGLVLQNGVADDVAVLTGLYL